MRCALLLSLSTHAFSLASTAANSDGPSARAGPQTAKAHTQSSKIFMVVPRLWTISQVRALLAKAKLPDRMGLHMHVPDPPVGSPDFTVSANPTLSELH